MNAEQTPLVNLYASLKSQKTGTAAGTIVSNDHYFGLAHAARSAAVERSAITDIRSRAEYHDHDGELRTKYEYYHDMWSERDVKHGQYSEWAGNDQLIRDGFYYDGEQDSLWKMWYVSGEMREMSHWAKGKQEGKAQYYDRDGKLIRECSYHNGELHGIVYDYFPNGRMKEISQYQNGRRHGLTTTYNRKGIRKDITRFEEGQRKAGPKPEKPAKEKKRKNDENRDPKEAPDEEKGNDKKNKKTTKQPTRDQRPDDGKLKDKKAQAESSNPKMSLRGMGDMLKKR